ncbi:hypothetical protein SBA5_260029 [Candidatus Sulfotelmatomonas gaucii]|uniref:Uncharacterized protein n=1 Tax=Candidatus Sulfuritelmatomonas gaucii TaxID=2043161 RepID=A0A2N9LAW4_9BACT|nr:hypothetical protein SBA5_260029 [Candidatus Sulfotelmatomonas gaucii]
MFRLILVSGTAGKPRADRSWGPAHGSSPLQWEPTMKTARILLGTGPPFLIGAPLAHAPFKGRTDGSPWHTHAHGHDHNRASP